MPYRLLLIFLLALPFLPPFGRMPATRNMADWAVALTGLAILAAGYPQVIEAR
jgi:hypothetical protein